ncbi:TPA: retron Ec67 family RNA-directed DNA polymerase/endonuclease [Enterococcus faecium]
MMEINEIKSRTELAWKLRIPKKKLTYVLYIKGTDQLYTTFEIPKKSGGVRKIHAPEKDLKDIQKNLANILVDYQSEIWKKRKIKPNISHGFEKKKGIMTNAEVHKNKRFVFNVDLENFFESFHFGRVRGFFEKNKYFDLPLEVATIIAQLTCYKGTLPQGSPCSPIITNLICNIFDMRIMKLAKRYRLDYSRYVDDLTFSTNDKRFIDDKEYFFEELSGEVEKAGFKINEKKTNLRYKDSKQIVTGLVVNKKINVDRCYYKKTRAMLNSLYKTDTFEIEGNTGTIKQIEGRLSFINQIDRHNNHRDSNKHDFRNLSAREKQYQAFLFYKYFFINDKPIVITEGKTDIKYIQAALKKYYLNYPELIVRNDDHKFEYKIMFLKRTKRLNYFFGLNKDGADAMQNLYHYFYDYKNSNITNYMKYFKGLSKKLPSNPTIFIFDNELAEGNKPVRKFVNHISLAENKCTELEKEEYVNLNESAYLLVNPLVDNKKECEIEDLFLPETLEHKINNKTFCRNKSFKSDEHYGKEIFSNYIMKNYKIINFENFQPMLNNLSAIISSYKK